MPPVVGEKARNSTFPNPPTVPPVSLWVCGSDRDTIGSKLLPHNLVLVRFVEPWWQISNTWVQLLNLWLLLRQDDRRAPQTQKSKQEHGLETETVFYIEIWISNRWTIIWYWHVPSEITELIAYIQLKTRHYLGYLAIESVFGPAL